MDNQVPKYVTRARAAYLLGLPVEELSRISEETGVGHVEYAGNTQEWFFTYEELQKICVFATQQPVGAH
ncbi:MAG TPA: hypothetical protein VEI54_10485 [Candidatus Limnocylindrales bacterium]|nr:hypothetical protein [Candidatus Limnocylindrales bacterium]